MRPRGSGLHVDMHLRHAVRMAARQAFLQEAPQGAGHVCKLLKQQQPCTKAACAATTTHRGLRCRLSALCKRPLSARGRASHNIGAGRPVPILARGGPAPAGAATDRHKRHHLLAQPLGLLDRFRVAEHHAGMVHSFACVATEALFRSQVVPRFKNIERVARRKLLQLHAATELASLRVPPGNQLEALKGDRRGQHNIRINDQWRICFVWHDDGAHQVEIADYH